ncbi:MAG: metallophosphoesterase, partial [Oscillospiraceae bacterium]|nr:metallophosphoesterase [Oscillospiraceae bacterium]
LTHAPARHINDFDTLSHRGFACFSELIDRWQPKYFVHGHVQRDYGPNIPQRDRRGNTEIINAFEYCLFDYT